MGQVRIRMSTLTQQQTHEGYRCLWRWGHYTKHVKLRLTMHARNLMTGSFHQHDNDERRPDYPDG